jgi:hypothetical protein
LADDYQLTSAADVDAIVTAIVEPLLTPAGFTRGARRKWVRAHPPIRHLFELTTMKGAQFAPRWGLSLDFVPHPKGKTLAWHRTDKSASADLMYDPFDFDADWERWAINSIYGPARVRTDAERVLPAAVRAALAWFDGVHDIPAALVRADELRTAERPAGRFRFTNYVQQPIAYAFLLARTGSRDAALAELERGIEFHQLQHLREKLIALLDEPSPLPPRP